MATLSVVHVEHLYDVPFCTIFVQAKPGRIDPVDPPHANLKPGRDLSVISDVRFLICMFRIRFSTELYLYISMKYLTKISDSAKIMIRYIYTLTIWILQLYSVLTSFTQLFFMDEAICCYNTMPNIN